MSTAVVFGGSGFIGTHLINSLAKSCKFDEIICADIVTSNLPVGATYRYCDVRHPITLAADDVTAVYNLAAVHRTPGHNDHEYFETNVLGAHNVTAWADAHGVQLVVFVSSISVYGPSEDPKDESSPLLPTSPYGHSKHIAERIHRSWASAYDDRRLVIVRPACVYGPGERGNFTRLAAALRSGTFVFPGRVDTVKACGAVDELIRTIDWAVGLNRPEVLYNFCWPRAYTTAVIVHAMRVAGELHRPRGTIPAWLLLAIARVLELAGSRSVNRARVRKLMESTYIVPKFLCANGYKFAGDLNSSLREWAKSGMR